MSTANTGTDWRKAVTNHLQTVDAGGEHGHYPWGQGHQRTGVRSMPQIAQLLEPGNDWTAVSPRQA